MNEAVTGLEVNFANGGSAHSASVTSVEDVVSPNGDSALGGISGGAGERPVFTESKLNELLENFILTEKTVSKDSVKTTISRKYSDKTSLILQANILLVRGINASPTTNLDFEGIVPFWGEVSNAPPYIRYKETPTLSKFPVLPPVKSSKGITIIGKIYNISSEDASIFAGPGKGYDIHQATLVYQNGIFKEKFSQNHDKIPAKRKETPDLTGFSLKFGYSLSDFKTAVKNIGVKMMGLPDMPDVLFEYSGTFESVISSIASDIGYYWFVHPQTGVVTMVNSKIAADYEIKDPTEEGGVDETVLSYSYTKSELTPVVINTYVGSGQKDSGSEDAKDIKKKPRATNFKRIYFDEKAGIILNITFRLAASFFGLWLSGKFTYPNFKKMAWALMWKYKGNLDAMAPRVDLPLFGASYPYEIDPKVDDDPIRYKDIKLHELDEKSEEIGDRTLATYVQLKFKGDKLFPEPALKRLFEDLKMFYENFGGIGLSHGFSAYKSDRMSFPNTSGVTVIGPYHKDTKIKKIKELVGFDNQLVRMNLKNKRVSFFIKLIENQERLYRGQVFGRSLLDHYFFSFRNVKEFAQLQLEEELKVRKGGDGNLDYDFLEENMEILVKEGVDTIYLGGKGGWVKEMDERLAASFKLYRKLTKEGGVDRVTYEVGKSITNQDKIDTDDNDRNAGTTPDDEKLQQLTENLDLKNYSIVSNGADGDPLRPATLNAASGSSLEMAAVKEINEEQQLPEDPLVSSSKTFYGLEIPEFKPTHSSLSINVGSDGVTTKVGESSLKLIPISMDIMKDRHLKTSISKSSLGRLRASQKNFMGL